MKTFSDYQIAEISEKSREEITKLENEIKKGTDRDVVLIAYQEK
ncbi:MAG: hypothetical protein PUC65_00030 [Clostridiales bacterium]|nr:hypothetical protein [Clostridiales bacterium]